MNAQAREVVRERYRDPARFCSIHIVSEIERACSEGTPHVLFDPLDCSTGRAGAPL